MTQNSKEEARKSLDSLMDYADQWRDMYSAENYVNGLTRKDIDQHVDNVRTYIESLEKLQKWGTEHDAEDALTAKINDAFPTNTGDWDSYRRASELIGSRHSKFALINLVSYLLAQIKKLRHALGTSQLPSKDIAQQILEALKETDQL